MKSQAEENPALEKIYELLLRQIVPALEVIQRNQAQMQAQQASNAEALQRFRLEMLTRFVEYAAELAVMRVQVEDAMSMPGLRKEKKAALGQRFTDDRQTGEREGFPPWRVRVTVRSGSPGLRLAGVAGFLR